MVLVRAADGELVFDGEHMLTTSTRAVDGAIRDVLYEPLPARCRCVWSSLAGPVLLCPARRRSELMAG
ncbi:hypothetical protein OG618_36900 [Kitasatospora sp. NBC_01246]|uniref:hypothetical protein n=1 Tax=Kitasatospora sp. NBC_01246 TaxID=2903570 RepID=UPI002E36A6A0|nr:hypothetical protein [Kitasatospora sp. NBC_01246]